MELGSRCMMSAYSIGVPHNAALFTGMVSGTLVIVVAMLKPRAVEQQ